MEVLAKKLSQLCGEFERSGTDYPLCGYHQHLTIGPGQLRPMAEGLKAEGLVLEFITAVDLGFELELIYFFNRILPPLRLKVSIAAPYRVPVPSLYDIYPIADWQEREVFDLFGLRFSDHPNLVRILLPADADFHPLRNSFTAGREHDGDHLDMERL